MSRVQIVEIRKGETRWKFVAHGAAYERQEAEAMQISAALKGHKIRFLPLAKGE